MKLILKELFYLYKKENQPINKIMIKIMKTKPIK